ncbi:TPA: ATP-dependent sacrificial sulfur transferase LarE [Candidatus Micrarchaeota archaeon]|nr:ATP-dependent sacrificial sulfur transferase LarE [Candidatus Micrarchaeota archaeon]
MDFLDKKILLLRKKIRLLGNALVAYSGGVDSTLVLKIAADELGEKCAAVTSVSASYPQYELDSAKEIARGIGARHIFADTTEICDPGYVKNFSDRFYFCKKNLYGHMKEIAKQNGMTNLLNGANKDDEGDHRPGMIAADEFKVVSPLRDAGITKKEIVEIARRLGLPNWNKPASPCLASRIPYGSKVTDRKLEMIEKAEFAIKNICNETGLRHLRVRHYGKEARIEVPKENFKDILGNIEKIRTELVAAGFKNVTLDLEGFKSGKLNKGLNEGRKGTK